MSSGRHVGQKRPFEGGVRRIALCAQPPCADWAPRGGMGPRGMPFGRGRGFMDGPFGPGGMMGRPPVGMPPMGGRGPMAPGPGMMGPMRPRPDGMMPGMMSGRGGRGGFRGGVPPGGRGGMPFPGRGSGFAKRPRTDGMPGQRPSGFLGVGGGGGGGMLSMQNKPPQDRETLEAIEMCVTPESVLSLWSSNGDRWQDSHIAHALLVFSKLVDETCPEDVVKMRTMPACVNMINKGKNMMCEMRPTDCSKIARAMGKLDLQDEDLCVTLVDALKVLLPESPPIAVAGIMAGLGMVSYRPAASVLHSVERYVVGNAHRLTPKDVKDFLVAFTAMEAPPDAEMVNASILQLPKNFQDTLPKDLATLITTLRKLDFRPPEPFVIACANFTAMKLEGTVAGMVNASTLEISTLSTLMSGLVAWKFSPPPPMLMMVSKVLLAQMQSAAPADVCDLLEIFASAYWHPSLPVLNAAQDKLESCCSDLQLVNLCTSLWSFAIFAFVPHISLQRVYATRIEQEIEDLNPFQLCSVLWVFALFRSCTVGVWNTLVSKLGTFDVNDIDESALRYFYQVYMFIRASANTINLDAYRMPQRLLAESDKAWRLKKREESREPPTEFDSDVKRVLGLLQFKQVDTKTVIHDGLFTVDIWVRSQEVAIMCLSQDKFTLNPVPSAANGPRPGVPAPQPLGQTKMMQNLFTACKVPVVMVPQHIWVSMENDELKRDFLQRHIRQTTSESIMM